jgi:hypothetical protein
LVKDFSVQKAQFTPLDRKPSLLPEIDMIEVFVRNDYLTPPLRTLYWDSQGRQHLLTGLSLSFVRK